MSIKAVGQLNETTMLISDLFEMLPQIASLGVDAFGTATEDNNVNKWFNILAKERIREGRVI